MKGVSAPRAESPDAGQNGITRRGAPHHPGPLLPASPPSRREKRENVGVKGSPSRRGAPLGAPASPPALTPLFFFHDRSNPQVVKSKVRAGGTPAVPGRLLSG